MNLFITNREIITLPDGTETVREDGKEAAGDNLRFGSYNLNTKSFNLFPEPKAENQIRFNEITHEKQENLLGSSRFFRSLYDDMVKSGKKQTRFNKTKGDVLFFIHGFNNDLDGVRTIFDTLNRFYVDNPDSPIEHIVMFTWPGRTPTIPFHYHDDKKDAIRSGETLARGIEKLKRFFTEFIHHGKQQACNQSIHLMAHSMGHRVLKHMLLDLKEVPEIFGEILLMAADIDYDIFDRGNAFYQAINLGARVHVYFHEKDRVLGISKYTKSFSNRLGQYGRKSIDPGLKDVYDANVSGTTDDPSWGMGEDLLNHWYFYTSTDVINDVTKVLNGEISGYVKL